MGLHSARWRVHASAVDDVPLIQESLVWLTGDSCEIILQYELNKQKIEYELQLKTLTISHYELLAEYDMMVQY